MSSKTLRLSDGSYMRHPDVESIMQYLYVMQCVEIIGFSNIGKSALLRLLSQTDVWVQELGQAGQEFLPVYIDCNRMLGMTDQGFYELVLRCLQECSEDLATLPELTEAYETLVTPSSDFQIPLSFNRGLTAVLQSTKRKLILLFDEFDEPFGQINSRVFLNLRAMKDRHNSQLVYVTATVQPLVQKRTEDHPENHCAEFCELFNHRTWNLAPLTRSDVERYVRRYIEAYETPFTATDIDFIYGWAGGHPGMLEGTCRILAEAVEGLATPIDDSTERWQLHRTIGKQLRSDENLVRECTKIWETCTEAEQNELLTLFTEGLNPNSNPAVLADLQYRHILFKIDGVPQMFCRLMAEYVQQLVTHERPESAALWVDVASGEVTVGGNPVDALTNLEYKLMVLLFQNADKIVNKYQIVTKVWGESYIDDVDDARIEKLISRLRQKIEPDPSSPRFLTTIRGRGYRLALS